jgi:flagellar biosynthetic protein FlhB
MAKDSGDRTEEPTPKRRQDARRKGEVAQSRDVASVLVLAMATAGLGSFAAEDLGHSLAGQARAAWGPDALLPETVDDFRAVFVSHILVTARAMAPTLLLLAVVGVGASLLQTGPLFSPEALKFKPNRMDPLKGLQRMVSSERLVELGKAISKLAIVVGAAGFVLWTASAEVIGLLAAPPASSLGSLQGLVVRFAGIALLALAALAVLDYAHVRYRHEKKLKMTKREVRDEQRDREGNPQLRGRMRQIQRDLSRQRMIAAVADSDVVVTNPSHYAVALRYAAGEMGAPSVLAKGRNHVAKRIRDAARRQGVPIYENPPLARLLYRTTRVGREVPASLYRAVAEVMAYVYRLDPHRSAGWKPTS